jgi:hypothetical protein
MRRALALAALTVAVVGCGGDDPAVDARLGPRPDGDPAVVDAMPRDVIVATQSLVPGELVEGIMTGGPDDTAVIHLIAPVAELDWNIHGHEDGGTQTVYEELNVLTADYVFIPSSQTDWWLLIRNSGPTNMDVQVRVELYGAMAWRWQ